MEKEKKICRYENIITRWKCPYEALEDSKDGFCIFHERRNEKDIKKFNEGIKNILKDKDSDAYHFEGFFFSDSVSFREFPFEKSVFFTDAEFSGENTDFSGTLFSGKNTDFRGTEFSGRNTYFMKTLFLSDDTTFEEAKFPGKTAMFYHPRLKNTIRFWRTCFEGKASFTAVDLRKCAFIKVDLKNVDFNLIDWDWKYKLANETELEERSKGIQLGKRLDEIAEKLFKRQWLRGLHEDFGFSFKASDISEVYGQLKVQFTQKRDFAKAGMFHFREQECKRMSCWLLEDFFKWIFLRFLKWSCGYGEKLSRVLISSVQLILGFAIVYMWWFGLYTNDQNETLIFKYRIAFENTAPIWTIVKDFFTSVSFSIKGFFPLWKFQQYKVVGDFANLVAGLEFLLGAFMVGLFIYVFRRRMEK